MARNLCVGFACALVLVIVAGCKGDPGFPGANGKNMVARTSSEPSGGNCANGGIKVETGIDDNGNETLDDGEIDLTVFVCNGADGQGVQATPEEPGSNCPRGGVRLGVSVGTPTYVCNGETGATGQDGQSVVTTPEPAGDNCANGGQKLQVGSGTPTYVCNGVPGAAGQDGQSVVMTPEPAGDNCANGGQKLQVGSGTPAYVCNGEPGAAGQDGQSVVMTPEPPGDNCADGGQKLQVGNGTPTYVCNGTSPGSSLPSVVTENIADISYTSVHVNADVTNNGNEFIIARGVCLSQTSAPDVNATVYVTGTGSGTFSTNCDQLSPNTTYYVRAFATNTVGTTYGNELSFVTKALTVPTITTAVVSNITNATAISGGNITDDGGTPILTRGLCWSLNPNPTTADSFTTEGIGAGSYIALMTGLTSNTTYHVRAYATNAQGTSYGDDLSFTTVVLQLAAVTTTATSGISYTTAMGGGNVTNDNGAPVTSRGICWATTSLPTTANSKYTEAGGLGVFTTQLTGLSANTKYYVRAFAVNGGGTSYGNEVSFTTLTPSVPSLTTKSVGGISSNLAGSGGTINTDGGSAITAKGVCWSLNPTPTLANSFTTDGAGTASYNSTMTGLNPLTTYHVRAYATNGLGTAYGNEVSFTTTDLVNPGPTVPVVGTSTSTITSSSTASSGGYVSSDGGSTVTARGVCWSTTANPTLANNYSTDGGSGLGFFTSTITGISGCGTVYYIRAYATNSTGTGYGNQNTVSTGLFSSVTTDDVTSISYYTATSGGSITDNGGCPITQKGVCWSYNPNPTTGNPHTSEGAGSGAFVSNITGLYANRTYYVRAYATNSVGTTYGPQEVFTTATPSTPYIGQNYAGGIVFYVDGTGEHGLVCASADQGSYAWGCQGASIPTGTALGTGATNTAAIVASCSTANIAAKICDDLVLNGYSDWFLPSRDELSLMYTNLYTQGIGGLSSSYYRSSSEYDASYAFYFYFGGGYGDYYYKSTNWLVRAVRAF